MKIIMATFKPKKTKIEDKFVDKFLEVEEENTESPKEGNETDK